MNKTLTALLNNPDDLRRNLQPVLQYLPDISSAILIIANAHILALITWMLLSDQEPVTVAPLPTAKTLPQAVNQQAFHELTNAHLFGIMGKTGPVTTTKVPETRLNLILKGILADEPMQNASVIISRSKGGKEEVYGLGDKMPGGIIIKEIHSEHIILLRQGQLETLRLIKESGVGKASSKRSVTTSGAESLKNIRQKITTNPASFMEYATPVVVREAGRQIGYRLQPKTNKNLLAETGIQPTDVITSINGIKLNNPKNSMDALKKIRTANEINVMVQRNGIEVPLNIKLE